MEQLTFRDFAGAMMGGDTPRAADVLAELLGLEAKVAMGAVTHFQDSMAADPDFMRKAMGLRTAVTEGSDQDIALLLGDCFGLTGDAGVAAVATLRKRYPAT